ncbi:MAG: PQQ-binding-like beta-propeller repeat protein [Bacteroidetes bacterium]|nr:PQQ-binding-like beta-propeller repeat protein [Bacteroidota bacterium]
MKTFKPSIFFNKKLFILIASITIFSSCETNNWPQFRGPESNQHTSEKELPLEWSQEKNMSWQYELDGRGWSCPIIWGNQVFFTNAVLEDPSVLPPAKAGRRLDNPDDVVYNFEVICLDLNSGEEIWKQVAYHGLPRYKTHRDNNYAPETMVTDGKHVYAYFGMTGLYCYDMKGNLVWEKDLGNYPMQSNWGTSSSPVLYDNVLYMQIDNEEKSFLAALDSKTGEEKWRVSRDEKSNWGTPIIWKNSIRTELVVQGLKTRSYNPENGELLWKVDMGGGRNITSPTADLDMIFVGNEKRSNGGGTLFGIKAGAAGDISLKESESSNEWVVWSVPESGIAMASPVIYNGLIYIVERNRGQIFCYEAASGKAVYPGTKITDAKAFWASPWVFDEKIYCLDEKGTTHVIQAGRTFKELGKNKLDDIFWASTAIAKSSYVFRGEKGIYCIR